MNTHNFPPEVKYRMFIDAMKAHISEAVQGCFDADTDPNVCWEVFREALRKFKRENIKSYQMFLDSDDETPLPESEISKWRRNNNNTN